MSRSWLDGRRGRSHNDEAEARRWRSHPDGAEARRGRSHRGGAEAHRGQSHRGGADGRRGQSHVVGVAILLAITTISLGALTAGVGGLVESNAAAADADRVADTFASIRPAEATGRERHRLAFGEGRLSAESRTVRVLDEDGVVASHDAEALVFETGDRRVTFLAGAVVRGEGEAARVTSPPPIATSDSLLVVGLPVLNAVGPDSVGGAGGTTVTLATDTSHERRSLGEDRFRVAVETETPAAWEAEFDEMGAETARREFDDDGVPSVVARFPGERTGYLVVHDAKLAVEP